MVVTAARNEVNAAGSKPLCQCLTVVNHALLIVFKFIFQCFAEANRFTRDDVHQRTALCTGENRLVHCFREFFIVCENQTAARTAERFVRGGGDDIGIRHGRGMQACGNQTRDMRHIHHKVCADLFRDFGNAFKVDDARIRRCACDNQLRLTFFGFLFKFVIIDVAVPVHTVSNKVEVFARHIDGRAVGQVSALGKIHTHNGIAGLNQRKIRRHIRLRARMRLYVGKIRTEQFTGTLDRDIFYDIDALTAAVIALARITLGIFVGQHTAHCRHNGRGNDVFAGNQLQISLLTGKLLRHRRADFFVVFCDKPNGVH